MTAKWLLTEIAVSDLRNEGLEDITAGFRGEQPRLLVYRLKHLPWIGVAKLAPLNFALCATSVDYPRLFNAESHWASSLIADESIYKAFLGDLRLAGIKKEHVQREFFAPYVGFGAYCGKTSLVFGKNRPDLGQHRIAGSLVPNEVASALIEHFENQLTQFSEHAFLHAEEGIERPTHMPTIQLGGGYFGARLFAHVYRTVIPDEGERQKALQPVRAELWRAVENLESGRSWEPDLYFSDRIRLPASFHLGHDEGAHVPVKIGNTQFKVPGIPLGRYPASAEEAEIYGLRARLVRLLGWPQAYPTVERALATYKDQVRALPIEFPTPYDIAIELEAYLQEMRKKYPVILDNPLSTVIMKQT